MYEIMKLRRLSEPQNLRSSLVAATTVKELLLTK